MTDTSTPPEPAVQPEMPEENQGKSRMWLYFLIGLLFLLVIIYYGNRTGSPPPADPQHPAVTLPNDSA